MSKGIITYANNEQYIKQAVILAVTARKNSNLPVSLVVPESVVVDDSFRNYFDTVISLELSVGPDRGLLDTLTNSPYENTLFLYSDSLVLSDINDIYAQLDFYDIVMNDQLLDFKGSNITRQLYEQRKIIVKNNLTDVWSNAILYKKTDNLLEWTKLAHRIITFWQFFRDQHLTEYGIDDKLRLKFNTALCLAMKLADTTVARGFPLTTLSMQEENTASLAWANLDWFVFLNAWILDNGQVKVENYVQSGILHYGKSWMNDDIYNRLLKVYA
jgi:hypothetical protein